MAAYEGTQRRRELARVACPACGTEVLSPSLSPSEILYRHLRSCRWEPEIS